MHICLITGIFPPDIGGPATYVSGLADALRNQQHDVKVVTLGTPSPQDSAYVTRISRSYPLPIRLFLLFVTLLRHGRHCGLWYINGLEVPAVLAGLLLRKCMVMKIVGDYAWERAMNAGTTTDLIDDFQHTKQPWKVEAHKALRAWYVRQVAQVITPSQYLKALVCGWGVPEERVRVIYNAVEPVLETLPVKAELRKQLGLSKHEQFLITVARLVPWKGIDQIIAALPHLHVSVKFLIVGDGPQKEALVTLAEQSGVTDRVVFLGKLSRIETFRYLGAADTFVLNTTYEGFSHVLLEAMMVEIPILTTPCGGNLELVIHQQNGILASAETPQELAGHIEAILGDAALQRTLVAGGQKSLQHYTWERLLQQTLDLLIQS